VDQLAQVVRGVIDAVAQLRGRGVKIGGRAGLAELLRPDGQQDQLDLDAVVQVLGDAPALTIPGFNYPGAGEPQRSLVGDEFGGEPLIADGDGRDAAGRLHQLGILVHRSVVHERAYEAVTQRDLGDAPARVTRQSHHRASAAAR
jgi:hypothetical protein